MSAPASVAAVLDDTLTPALTLFELAVDPPTLWEEHSWGEMIRLIEEGKVLDLEPYRERIRRIGYGIDVQLVLAGGWFNVSGLSDALQRGRDV